MRVVASKPAVDLIEQRGGRLYVWVKTSRCCGRLSRLASATEAPTSMEFRRLDESERFELYIPVRLGRLPDELHIDLQRFPRRIEAYWDGCAWVV